VGTARGSRADLRRCAIASLILFTRGLDVGGAERQLVALAIALHRRNIDVKVLTFYEGGALSAELAAAAVPILSLRKRGRWDVVGFLARLVGVLRRERPQTLYSFLTVPNIVAAAVQPLAPRLRLVWGLRASRFEFTHYDTLARAAAALESLLSRVPDRIISNSFAGRQCAIERGFPASRIVVVPNGIDTDRFELRAEGRRSHRVRWGVAANEVLIGIVARMDPMKDHATFLRAMARVAGSLADARFVCVGHGDRETLTRLQALAQDLCIGGRTTWAGIQDDMAGIYSALDIVVSSSAFGEGFSNSVAEAMACERLCVVTDVGDSARIVGDAGFVVGPGDDAALATGVLQAAAKIGTPAAVELGAQARARIAAEFGLAKLPGNTLAALRD
jgi:glycosyltransferase involved in cell wall biosynthesis